MVIIVVDCNKTILIEKHLKEINGREIFCIKELEYLKINGSFFDYLSYFIKKIDNILKTIKKFGNDNIFIIKNFWFTDKKINKDQWGHENISILDSILKKSGIPEIDAYILEKTVDSKPTLILNEEDFDFKQKETLQIIKSFLESFIEPRGSIVNLPIWKLINLFYHDRLGFLSEEEIEFLNNFPYKNERFNNYNNMFLISIYINKTKKIDPRVINALKTEFNLNDNFTQFKGKISSCTPLVLYCIRKNIDINILKSLITEKNINIHCQRKTRDGGYRYNSPLVEYCIKNLNCNEEILLCLMENLDYEKVIIYRKNSYNNIVEYKKSIWDILKNKNISISMQRKLEELKDKKIFKK